MRETQRRGASVPAAHALLERVVRSLGSKISWSSMAREMDVPLGRGRGRPSHQTLRDYIELLAGGYFLFVTYFWRSGSQTNEQSRDKKVFFADPLLHTIALDHAPGLGVDTAALVENAIGIALLRRYEPEERLIETFILPERLHIWQTARGGEIDFVCWPPLRARCRRGQVPPAARPRGCRCRRAKSSGSTGDPGNEEHAAHRQALHAAPRAHTAVGTGLSATRACARGVNHHAAAARGRMGERWCSPALKGVLLGWCPFGSAKGVLMPLPLLTCKPQVFVHIVVRSCAPGLGARK